MLLIRLQMAAQVAINGYGHLPGINTDPGVYEPECDWGEPTGYPDTKEFLAGMETGQVVGEEVPPPPDQPHVQQQQLPLAGDYQGLGGPTSVPLYTPSAFQVRVYL